jgi:phospholipid/cholesterol/gamma-HCH transport system substrate-binding protein
MILNDKKLYDNLVNSSEALDALLSDLKENPKRYVHFSIFGRKENNNDNK